MKETFYRSLFFIFLFSFMLLFPFVTKAQRKKMDSLLVVLKTSQEDTSKVKTLNLLAKTYQNNNHDTSKLFAESALKLSEKLNYKPGTAYAKMIIAILYQNEGYYKESLEYLLQSLQITEELKDISMEAKVYNLIGNLYSMQAQREKGLEYYKKALSKSRLAKTENVEAVVLGNIGNYYYYKAFNYKLQKWDEQVLKKANSYYDSSLVIKQKVKDNTGIISTLNNMGLISIEMSDFENAKKNLTKAIEIADRLDDKANKVYTTANLGRMSAREKKYQEAIDYFDKATEIALEIDDRASLSDIDATLSEMYAEMKNYEKAYEYYVRYSNLKDSMINESSGKQIAEMNAKYESEKKQKEIELITKNNEIQALELNKNKLWIWMLVVAVLLVFSLAGLFYNRSKLKQKANVLLEHRNTEITQQKKEITDSINYAKRIQESILPPNEHWQKLLPESFIFYKPKDIVSGDFYWIEQKNEIVCFAAVDCTGHGVPGALMSVVGFNLLTQAVNEMNLTQPSDILKHLDAGVTRTLRQSNEGKGVKDGMDLSLCSLNKETFELQYAGAFNSLYYISNGVFNEIKADKFPIGVNLDGVVDDYTNHTIQLQKGDAVYLFSDGFADQFGGAKGKKYKYNQLKQLLISIQTLPIDEQKNNIERAFEDWKGNLEQIDDVLLIGVRV